MATETALVEAGPRAAAVVDKGLSLSTAQVIERTKRVREVMEAVMKPNVHYGVIPGTPKPTMYQPGADVLNVTFRIAPKVAQIDDLSTEDSVRYRITVQGVHQVTGEILSEGVGECSSDEEKYRWRKVVCDEEWNETPEDRRRAKWAKGSGGGKPYKAKQVRTSPADVANTVLKMAVKRAKVAMTISATAASDVFAQDLEDLSDELREHLADESSPAVAPPQPAQRVSQQPSTPATPEPATKEGAPAGETTAQASPTKNIGVIVDVLDKGNGAALIVLSTGMRAATTKADIIQAAASLRDSKRHVELETRPSKKAGNAPVVVGIEPAPEDA